jgi:hypothetical protein
VVCKNITYRICKNIIYRTFHLHDRNTAFCSDLYDINSSITNEKHPSRHIALRKRIYFKPSHSPSPTTLAMCYRQINPSKIPVVLAKQINNKQTVQQQSTPIQH